MMKSDWLPTMPLHVAIWSQLVLELDLSWTDQGMAIRLLSNAWSSGTLRRAQWATDNSWAAVERLWPEIDSERQRNLETRDSLSRRGKSGADARWNGPRMQRPLADDDSANATAKEQKQKQKHNQKQQQKQQQQPSASQKSSAPSRGNDTWLMPFGDAWRARYGGELAWSRAGSAFSPLREEHGAERVLRAWVRYVAATEAQFASPQRFASTFGQWDGTAPPAERPIDARGAARQNVPAPLPPDPEFRARYDESMRRRHASQSRLEPRRATNAPNPTTDDPWADDAPLIEDCKDCMEA